MLGWLGSSSPSAFQYYTAIKSANRFQPIDNVINIEPGDLLASQRLFKNSTITGHVMLAVSRVKIAKQNNSRKTLSDTLRHYELEVIDTSRSGHGPMDTRRHQNGTWGNGGAGRGTIQLQTDASGKLQGYRWSNQAKSPLRSVNVEPLVIGRFCGHSCRLTSRDSN
jgi:hypothetical protein